MTEAAGIAGERNKEIKEIKKGSCLPGRNPEQALPFFLIMSDRRGLLLLPGGAGVVDVDIADNVAVQCAGSPGAVNTAGKDCEQGVHQIDAEQGAAGSCVVEPVSADTGSLILILCEHI